MNRLSLTIFLLLGIYLSACSIPSDPQNTTDSIFQRGFIRVGVTEDHPWIIQVGDHAEGIEGNLVQKFAEQLGVGIEWHWGSTETNLHELAAYNLDLVIGNLNQSSPWSNEVAFTRPYLSRSDESPKDDNKTHVMAVPPGENKWLFELEKFLQAQTIQGQPE